MGKRTTREREAEGRSETGTSVAGTGAATGDLAAHPLAEQFPLLEGAEYARFKRDIERNGLIDPITVHDGLILDGRNRHRACRELGIEARTVDWSGQGTTVTFICSRNAHRRQLTDGGRALIASGIATLKPGRPGKTASIEAVSQTRAAELLGVSRTDVQHATRVLGCGDATLEAMVRRGEVAVSAAAAVAAMPAAQRSALVARGPEAIKKRRREPDGPAQAAPTPPSLADASQSYPEAAADGAPVPAPAHEPASKAAAPAERDTEAATPTADGRRDPGRYPLRQRLANPAFFDGELADYWDHADRRAREGGGALDRETYLRLFDAASFYRNACLSVRRVLILPPEEWSLCGDCKGEGCESSGICACCGGAGFLNFPDSTQAWRFARGLALATDTTSAAIPVAKRRGRKRNSTVAASGGGRGEGSKAPSAAR